MPIRQVDPDDKLRVWRNFQIGKLLVCFQACAVKMLPLTFLPGPYYA